MEETMRDQIEQAGEKVGIKSCKLVWRADSKLWCLVGHTENHILWESAYDTAEDETAANIAALNFLISTSNRGDILSYDPADSDDDDYDDDDDEDDDYDDDDLLDALENNELEDETSEYR